MKITKLLLMCLLAASLSGLLNGGCQAEKESNTFSFFQKVNLEMPQGWEKEEEKADRARGRAALQLRNRENPHGKVILTYLSREHFCLEKAEEEAVELLESSLFRLQGEIEKTRKKSGGRKVIYFNARAGELETKKIYAALITGDTGHVIVNLIVDEDDVDFFLPYRRELINAVNFR